MRLSSFFPKATHSCAISFLINALFVRKLLGKNKLDGNCIHMAFLSKSKLENNKIRIPMTYA